MNEIKFRAYNKSTGLWYSNERIKSLGNLHKLMMLKHVVLMQFTGLQDKNWVEIYEEDIVQCDYINIPLTVSFDLGAFVLKVDGRTRICNINQSYITVIGNIFDNAELLQAAL